MDIVQVVALALVQGLTEFLPISSSGHLILAPRFVDWTDQGLGFDIAVHLGTLVAVIVYFRRELSSMLRSLFVAGSPDARLAWQLVIASVPLGIAGLLAADLVETRLRNELVIAAASAGFGVLLYLADRTRRGDRNERELSLTEAILIGLGQALALIPGTSRSGITMTVALALGLNREAAGRFSFLLAIPAIGMAASWQIVQLAADPAPLDAGMLLLATALAALTAFAAIAVFLRLIERIGMVWFAAYRILLAAVIVYVFV